ncbi:MAG: hypothetical protein JXR88_06190 [Clostridia bacterium]|nr:hypothetical protein [Clostridia bacterium]
MKKILVLIIATLLLVGCKETVVEPEPEIVIEKDENSYHSIKLYTENKTIPYIISFYDEMDDETYGTYVVETYDSNFEPVWTLKWRDLEKKDTVFAKKPFVYEDKLIANVQGVISIHDLLSGEFLWEIETNNDQTGYSIREGILYVLYYGEDLVTGFDLSNGEQIFHFQDDLLGLNAVFMDSRYFVLYTETDLLDNLNGYAFGYNGEFLKQVHMSTPKEQKISWQNVQVSDESLNADMIIDGDLDTAWLESVKGYGEKEWVELTKTLPSLINRLVIYSGDHSSEKNYEENAKLLKVNITVGDGRSFNYVFKNEGYRIPDVIEFIKPVTADYMILTIEEALPGTLFKSTGITEIYAE